MHVSQVPSACPQVRSKFAQRDVLVITTDVCARDVAPALRPASCPAHRGGTDTEGARHTFAHPDLRLVFLHIDCDRLCKLFAIGLVKSIRELQGDLVLPWLQLELPLRLPLAIVLVCGIHWDGHACVREG